MAARHLPPPPPPSAAPAIDRLLGDLAQAARVAAGAQAAGVWLLDSGSCLALRAHDGLRQAEAVARVAPSEWFAGAAAALEAEGAGTPLAARAWIGAEGARKLFVAPLVVQGRVVGSLVALLRGGAPARGALRRITVVAAGAAPALSAALAHAAMQARAERAEALLAVTQALAGTADLDAAVAEVARLATRALAAEGCAIVLSPPLTPAADDPDALVVPIAGGDTSIGTLTVTAPGCAAWPPDAVELARAIAAQVALGADSARAHRATRAQADELATALGDLKAVQQRLVQGETLRAIGELAGGAAHHLNNLLTIVVGRVQLLLRTVEDERVSRPLEIVERAAKDGAEVVRRLQQFSRMRDVTQTRRVDLNAVAADVLEMTRGHWHDAARARGVSIEMAVIPAPVAHVAGDPAGLREAVTNLVLNAVDAMPKGGRITVETASDGATVTLAVTDTGIGMGEDVRLRAHEPFFTTKGVKATGLGLSVAYGIARRHSGELTIASTPGEGSTITLRLPALAAAGPMPVTPPAPAGARRLHILLVDDEREVRDALAEMLASQGHTVLTAGNGADAMEWVETEPALELVLTDLVMPGMTGWDVAAAVKARRPHIAVGVISGWHDAAPVAEDRRDAVDFLIDKPVTIAALNEAVARVRTRGAAG